MGQELAVTLDMLLVAVLGKSMVLLWVNLMSTKLGHMFGRPRYSSLDYRKIRRLTDARSDHSRLDHPIHSVQKEDCTCN